MSVREGLLALLAAGPAHGYRLRGDFEAATAGVWPLNVGQVYTTLDRLHRDGLVEQVGPSDGDRRTFAITDAGRAELSDWFSSGPDATPHREPTIIKVLVALRTTGVDTGQVIDAQRSALNEQLLQQRRAQRKALADLDRLSGDDELAAAMLFDALISRLEADLRWLELCERRLASLPPARKDLT